MSVPIHAPETLQGTASQVVHAPSQADHIHQLQILQYPGELRAFTPGSVPVQLPSQAAMRGDDTNQVQHQIQRQRTHSQPSQRSTPQQHQDNDQQQQQQQQLSHNQRRHGYNQSRHQHQHDLHFHKHHQHHQQEQNHQHYQQQQAHSDLQHSQRDTTLQNSSMHDQSGSAGASVAGASVAAAAAAAAAATVAVDMVPSQSSQLHSDPLPHSTAVQHSHSLLIPRPRTPFQHLSTHHITQNPLHPNIHQRHENVLLGHFTQNVSSDAEQHLGEQQPPHKTQHQSAQQTYHHGQNLKEHQMQQRSHHFPQHPYLDPNAAAAVAAAAVSESFGSAAVDVSEDTACLSVLPIQAQNPQEHHTSVQTALQCPHCPAVFENRSDRRAHVRVTHTKPFGCPLCPSTFTRKFDLEKHTLTVHERKRPYACPAAGCEQTFGQKHHLSRHIKAVHAKRKDFSCSLCTAEFARKEHLANHTRSVHEKEKPFMCLLCDVQYCEKRALRRHLTSSHNVKASRAQVLAAWQLSSRSNPPNIAELLGV